MTNDRLLFTLVTLVLAIGAPGRAHAQATGPEPVSRHGAPKPQTESDLQRLNAEVSNTARAYKESLEQVLALYRREFHKLAAEVAQRSEIYAKGYVARVEVEQSQQNLALIEVKIKETEFKLAEVDAIMREAMAQQDALLRRSEIPEATLVARPERGKDWSLAEALRVERLFVGRFGRPLPISAQGQTALHAKMKLDHRDATDVALHPDSLEGQWLIAQLRQAGIPFITFRNRLPGSATAAHIHIGRPSGRMDSR